MEVSGRFAEMREELARQRRLFDRWREQKTSELDEATQQHNETIAQLAAQRESLAQRERKALAQVQRKQRDIQMEQENVAQLEQQVEELRLKEIELPRKLSAAEKTRERFDAKNKAHKAALTKQETELRSKMQELAMVTEMFKQRLGLEFVRGDDDNVLRLVFIYIDPAHPLREFSFAVHVDDEGLYHVRSCSPPVAALPTIVDRLNDSGHFPTFVLSMRREFQRSV